MKRIILLAFVGLVTFSSSAIASKSKDAYCSVAKYASKDYVYYPAASIGKMFVVGHAVLSPLWVFKTFQRGLTINSAAKIPPASKVLKMTGKLPYLKIAARTLVPFMKQTSSIVNRSRVKIRLNGASMQRSVRTNTDFDDFYRAFVKWKKRWKYFFLTYQAFRISTLAVCGKAKVFFVEFCIRKGLKTKCGGLDDDEGFVLHDKESGQNVASLDLNQCSTSNEAQAGKFVALAKSHSGLFAKATNDMKRLSAFLKKSRPTAERIARVLKPLIQPIKKTHSLMKKVDLFLKGLGVFTPSITKVLRQRICVSFKYPKPVKTCTKIKVFGKKKRVCAVKVKMEKKKFCTRVETALKDMSKLAKPVQKPMDQAIKALINPIIKKVTKHVLKLDLGPFEKVQRTLTKELSKMSTIMKGLDALMDIPLKQYKTQFDVIGRKIDSYKQST